MRKSLYIKMFQTAAKAMFFFLHHLDVASARVIDNSTDETLFDERNAQDYREAVNAYKKLGMTTKEAKAKVADDENRYFESLGENLTS